MSVVASSRTGLVLAAGFGSRLHDPESATVKPLTLVGGTPLILRAFASLERAGCDRIVVVLGYRGEALQAAIAALHQGPVPIEFVQNNRFELANGVSALAAAARLGPHFVITMADHVLGDEVMALAANHTPPEGGATLLVDRRIDDVFDLDDATKVRTEAGRIVDIGKQLNKYDCIDVGVFVCTHGLLDALADVLERKGDASLSEGVAALAAAGKMHTLEIGGGFWQDVDTPQMLAHAERCLAARR